MLNNIPVVTKNLLLINVMLFVVSMVLLSNGIDLFQVLSARYFNSIYFEPYQVVTHMFMHSNFSIGHIFFNMFALVVFGSHLERIWGAKRYFIFYMASGLGAFLLYNGIGVYQLYDLKNQILASNLLQERGFQNLAEFHARIMENADSNLAFTPEFLGSQLSRYQDLTTSSMLGASGAIFGLLTGFVILFPNTELQLLFIPFPIKAKYLIGGYIVYEIYNSLMTSSDGVAHLAHVGGAIVGAAFVLYWRKTDRRNFY